MQGYPLKCDSDNCIRKPAYVQLFGRCLSMLGLCGGRDGGRERESVGGLFEPMPTARDTITCAVHTAFALSMFALTM